MSTEKETSRARVKKWRDALQARGRKEVRPALEKKSVERLEHLQRFYGDVDYATVVSLALRVLEQTKSLIPLESILEEKVEAKAAKE